MKGDAELRRLAVRLLSAYLLRGRRAIATGDLIDTELDERMDALEQHLGMMGLCELPTLFDGAPPVTRDFAAEANVQSIEGAIEEVWHDA
jgi:hypothetical protein